MSIRPTFSAPETLPVFWLENKVEAPLTEAQVKKYRKHGCDILMAVTKHRPEVTASKLKRLGAFAVRWQDFHRAFTDVDGAKGRERFVIESFVEYLEELGMAHRRRIRTTDVVRLRAVLAALRTGNRWVAVREAFETADALTAMLDDVRQRLVETYPKAAALKRWGPKCGTYIEPGDACDWVGWELRRGHWKEWTFDFGVYFPHNRRDSIFFQAYIEGTKTPDKSDYWFWKDVTTRGTLDEEKLFALVERNAKKWGVV